MAKVGTAHIEVKPVLDREALEQVCTLIEESIRQAVTRGMSVATPPQQTPQPWSPNYPLRVTTTPNLDPMTSRIYNDATKKIED